MDHAVVRKQENSKMCLVCGLKNQFGLKASFYELDNGELVALFTPKDEHQGYPERLHGGIAMGLLDETIGRAIMMQLDGEFWGVTVEFSARFKKPIPLNTELRVVGRIENETRRFFDGTGEILLPNGEIALKGSGKYIKLPLSKIADFDEQEQEWRVVARKGDPGTVSLPESP